MVASCGMHQHETGLADVARPTDASGSVCNSFSLLRALLTMRSPQQRIEAKLVTLQSDLGARDSEIARLKHCIEKAEYAISCKQCELTSTVKIVESQDAKIAKLQSCIAQADEMAQHDKHNEELRIEKLEKTQTRPTVSIHPAFCYFRSRC